MFLVPLPRRSSELSRSFDRLFDDGFLDRFFDAGSGSALRSPMLDVAETEAGYSVSVDLPGVAKEDVKITIDGRHVSIDAECRREQEKKEGERVLYRERSSQSFSRSFTLPVEVDQDASQAKLENGVLTLTLSKKRASAAKRISVA
jgi:HSP20 family protein